ncbi:hypothetical protein BJ508DRAFT_306038 [Ascobolus immersus RN42]|uniref:Uncharacterized protein n=1 Tax=Ascobolus immersus RN42 TaxID=1160509 RepID=A0A3N4IBW7_ASCIM|nr:hypothetical protein BJ508DRAFT_306038 [Ascobolus immersus RN42]
MAPLPQTERTFDRVRVQRTPRTRYWKPRQSLPTDLPVPSQRSVPSNPLNEAFFRTAVATEPSRRSAGRVTKSHIELEASSDFQEFVACSQTHIHEGVIRVTVLHPHLRPVADIDPTIPIRIPNLGEQVSIREHLSLTLDYSLFVHSKPPAHSNSPASPAPALNADGSTYRQAETTSALLGQICDAPSKMENIRHLLRTGHRDKPIAIANCRVGRALPHLCSIMSERRSSTTEPVSLNKQQALRFKSLLTEWFSKGHKSLPSPDNEIDTEVIEQWRTALCLSSERCQALLKQIAATPPPNVPQQKSVPSSTDPVERAVSGQSIDEHEHKPSATTPVARTKTASRTPSAPAQKQRQPQTSTTAPVARTKTASPPAPAQKQTQPQTTTTAPVARTKTASPPAPAQKQTQPQTTTTAPVARTKTASPPAPAQKQTQPQTTTTAPVARTKTASPPAPAQKQTQPQTTTTAPVARTKTASPPAPAPAQQQTQPQTSTTAPVARTKTASPPAPAPAPAQQQTSTAAPKQSSPLPGLPFTAANQTSHHLPLPAPVPNQSNPLHNSSLPSVAQSNVGQKAPSPPSTTALPQNATTTASPLPAATVGSCSTEPDDHRTPTPGENAVKTEADPSEERGRQFTQKRDSASFTHEELDPLHPLHPHHPPLKRRRESSPSSTATGDSGFAPSSYNGSQYSGPGYYHPMPSFRRGGSSMSDMEGGFNPQAINYEHLYRVELALRMRSEQALKERDENLNNAFKQIGSLEAEIRLKNSQIETYQQSLTKLQEDYNHVTEVGADTDQELDLLKKQVNSSLNHQPYAEDPLGCYEM